MNKALMSQDEIIAEIAEILEDPAGYEEAVKAHPDKYEPVDRMVRVWVSLDAIESARSILYS